jgi:hypothetical protein
MRIPTKKLLTRYEGMLDERKFTVRMPDGSEKTVLYKGKKMGQRIFLVGKLSFKRIA